MNPGGTATGRELNLRWAIGAKHALYRQNGIWYHHLRLFPGALIDANGFMLFDTASDYHSHPGLQLGKEVHVPGGISSLKGYICVRKPAPVGPTSDSSELIYVATTAEKTTRQALIEARLGQGSFRRKLIDQWGGCALTCCTQLEALRASHIKPWAICTNRERLDPLNGLLLLGTFDALFDAGLISFADSGRILISRMISETEQRSLGLKYDLHLTQTVGRRQQSYLRFHRTSVFK